jgi:hypothetical protein
MKSSVTLLLAFGGLFAFSVNAATLTCTFQFLASGTIGAQSFTNAAVTLTTVGDTSNRLASSVGYLPPNGYYSIPNESATISISGVGTFQFSSPAQSSISVLDLDFNANSGEVEIYFFAGSARVGSLNAYASLPWDMLSSLASFSTSPYSISGWSAEPVSTTGGTINLSDTSSSVGSLTFQATITPTVAVTPNQLNLSYQMGSVVPVGVLQVSGTGSPGAFTLSTSGNWLSANPASTPNTTTGTTPSVGSTPVTVNISPSGLTAGSYAGSVNVTQNAATVVVPVNLTVTGPFTSSIYDVNGDGVVNIVDIQLVINAALAAAGTGKDN